MPAVVEELLLRSVREQAVVQLAALAAGPSPHASAELARLRRLLLRLVASGGQWVTLTDTLLAVVQAFPDRARRDTAAGFAVEALLESVLAAESRGGGAEAAPAPALLTFLLDSTSCPPRAQAASRALGCLTRLNPGALQPLLDALPPRLLAALGRGTEAAAWEEAQPLLSTAAAWRWRLEDEAAGRALRELCRRTLPALKRGAQQRPACLALARLAQALRRAAVRSPGTWYAQSGASAGAGAVCSEALGEAWALAEAWGKKKNGQQEALTALVALLAAAPPSLFRRPQRARLVQRLVGELTKAPDAAAAGVAIGHATALLLHIPSAALASSGELVRAAWRLEAAQLSSSGLAAAAPRLASSAALRRSAARMLLAAATGAEGPSPSLGLDALEKMLASAGSPSAAAALRALSTLLLLPPQPAATPGAAEAAAEALDLGGVSGEGLARARAQLTAQYAPRLLPLLYASLDAVCRSTSADEDAVLMECGRGGVWTLPPLLRLLLPAAAAAAEARAVQSLSTVMQLRGGGAGRAALRLSAASALTQLLPHLALPQLHAALQASLCELDGRVEQPGAGAGARPQLLSLAAQPGDWASRLRLLEAIFSEFSAREGAGGAAGVACASGGVAWGALRLRAEAFACLALIQPPAEALLPSHAPVPAAATDEDWGWAADGETPPPPAESALSTGSPQQSETLWTLARRVLAAVASPSLRRAEALDSEKHPSVAALPPFLEEMLYSGRGEQEAPLSAPLESNIAPELAELREASELMLMQTRGGAGGGPASQGSGSDVTPPAGGGQLAGTPQPLLMAVRALAAACPWDEEASREGPLREREATVQSLRLNFLLSSLRLLTGPPPQTDRSDGPPSPEPLRRAVSLRAAAAAASASALPMTPAEAAESAIAEAVVGRVLDGLWRTLVRIGMRPSSEPLLEACASLHPALHHRMSSFAAPVSSPPSQPSAEVRLLQERLFASLASSLAPPDWPSAPQPMRSSLDAALIAFTTSTSEDSKPPPAAVLQRLRLLPAAPIPTDQRSAAARRLLASLSQKDAGATPASQRSRAETLAALAELLRAGPLSDAECVRSALRSLERLAARLAEAQAPAASSANAGSAAATAAALARSEESEAVVDALAAALPWARWAAPAVASASLSSSTAAPQLWRALCRAARASPREWAAHAVAVPGGPQGASADLPPTTQPAVIHAHVPVGALVATALLHLPRSRRACRRDSLSLLSALSRAHPPASPQDAVSLRRLPPPPAALPGDEPSGPGGSPAERAASVAAAAAARCAEALHVSRSLAAAYPHWAPALLSALVPLAASCSSAGDEASELPRSLLLALARPWAAQLPRLLNRLCAPRVAAAAALAGEQASVGENVGGAPPPLQQELTPRSFHLDRFLGDSVAVVSKAAKAAKAAEAADAGGALASESSFGWRTQASAAVSAVAGAVLGLSGSGAGPEIAPLWVALIGGPEAAAAVARFLLDAHADGWAPLDAPGEGEYPSRSAGVAAACASEKIEGAVALLLGAPEELLHPLLRQWILAVRSHERSSDGDDGEEGGGWAELAAGGGTTPYQPGPVSRARQRLLERSALRLLAAAAALPVGAQLLAPYAPRLLHAQLALEQGESAGGARGGGVRLVWLFLRAAALRGGAAAAAAQPLLGAAGLLQPAAPAEVTPLSSLQTQPAISVPLLSQAGAALSLWQPGLRAGWRREALGWLSASRKAAASAPPRSSQALAARTAQLASLCVLAALPLRRAAPRQLHALCLTLLGAGAAGDAELCAAAIAALPSATGVLAPAAVGNANNSSGEEREAAHYAAAAALACLALPSACALRAALPLARALLLHAGAAHDRNAAAAAAAAGGNVRLLLAGCTALSRFWFALPAVPCDATAALMLLRCASLDGGGGGGTASACALTLLDALTVAQSDTLPAHNALLLLCLLAAACECCSGGGAPRARAAVQLLQQCGYALDGVRAAFELFFKHSLPTPPPAFVPTLCAQLALACPSPPLRAFAAQASARLARHGPRTWRAAALLLAAETLRARSRDPPPELLVDMARSLQRRGGGGPVTEGEAEAEAGLLSALMDCGSSLAPADARRLASVTAGGAPDSLKPDGGKPGRATPTPTPAASEPTEEEAEESEDGVPGAASGESKLLATHAAAWLRQYVLPGLDALPPGPADSAPTVEATDELLFLIQAESGGGRARTGGDTRGNLACSSEGTLGGGGGASPGSALGGGENSRSRPLQLSFLGAGPSASRYRGVSGDPALDSWAAIAGAVPEEEVSGLRGMESGFYPTTPGGAGGGGGWWGGSWMAPEFSMLGAYEALPASASQWAA